MTNASVRVVLLSLEQHHGESAVPEDTNGRPVLTVSD